jgi:putative addiction module CopG family antidote
MLTFLAKTVQMEESQRKEGASMSMQLTPDQERRVQSFVDAGLYTSAQDVVDAALAAVEHRATHGLEGTREELEELLLEGLHSGEPIEADESFWNRLKAETDGMVAEQQVRKPVLES